MTDLIDSALETEKIATEEMKNKFRSTCKQRLSTIADEKTRENSRNKVNISI